MREDLLSTVLGPGIHCMNPFSDAWEDLGNSFSPELLISVQTYLPTSEMLRGQVTSARHSGEQRC